MKKLQRLSSPDCSGSNAPALEPIHDAPASFIYYLLLINKL